MLCGAFNHMVMRVLRPLAASLTCELLSVVYRLYTWRLRELDSITGRDTSGSLYSKHVDVTLMTTSAHQPWHATCFRFIDDVWFHPPHAISQINGPNFSIHIDLSESCGYNYNSVFEFACASPADCVWSVTPCRPWNADVTPSRDITWQNQSSKALARRKH